ncbi:MAG: DMT family transporter [Proteobacteria bacterium]|nr:DMT family transporter [Pseudomonadota bacterium]
MTAASTSAAPGRGIAYTILGGALLTTNDAVLKWLTGDYPVGQIMFVRGMFVFLPIALLVWRAGGIDAVRINSLRGQSLRAVFAFTSGFLFITGLSFLPLAEAIAITFAGPLFITALAPPLLGEHVGWRRWGAVLIGFAGVMVIIRPGAEAVQWAALFPLAASLSGAFRDLTTRRIAATETSVSIMWFTNAVVVTAGLSTWPFGWVGRGACRRRPHGAQRHAGRWRPFPADRTLPLGRGGSGGAIQIYQHDLGCRLRFRLLGRPSRHLDGHRRRHRHRQRPFHRPPGSNKEKDAPVPVIERTMLQGTASPLACRVPAGSEEENFCLRAHYDSMASKGTSAGMVRSGGKRTVTVVPSPNVLANSRVPP